MPRSIDARLDNAFSRFTSSTDTTPGVVDAKEAKSLINTARTIDKENARFFGLVSDGKASKQLETLIKNEPGKFKPLAQSMVDSFVRTGRELDSRMVDNYLNFTGSADASPGVVDAAEAMQLIGHARGVNRENLILGAFTGPVGNEDLQGIFGSSGATFTAEAKEIISQYLQGVTSSRLLFSFKSDKPTWHCHWFPMKETRAGGGDAHNNLYAPGGVLEKYDEAFGAKSRELEMKTNFRPHDSTASDANWSGHCNNASEVAAMLKEPKYDVTYNGVTFSPHDVSGLLVKVSSSLSNGRVDFEGRRYNGAKDNPNDPQPHVFLEKVLKGWGSEAENPIPFVLDIDRKEQVWNYPYDQGEVYELSGPPADFKTWKLPSGGRVSFFEARLRGTDFEDQARDYQFWIQYSDDGSVKESGWIKADDEMVNPDFAWRPHPVGDLSKKENWVTRPFQQSNSEVKAEDVYEIYVRSLDKDYDSFVSRTSRWFGGLFG